MYWNGAGAEFTAKTVEIAVRRAQSEKLPLIIASCSGETVFRALKMGSDPQQVICVTHMVGFKNPGEDEMGEEARGRLTDLGVRVLTTTHVLAGIDRALRLSYGGIYPPEIVANALRMLGQGVKVCAEIAIMAADAGLVKPSHLAVAIGGSGRGADTAVVLSPVHSTQLFDLKIHEILAKPAKW